MDNNGVIEIYIDGKPVKVGISQQKLYERIFGPNVDQDPKKNGPKINGNKAVKIMSRIGGVFTSIYDKHLSSSAFEKKIEEKEELKKSLDSKLDEKIAAIKANANDINEAKDNEPVIPQNAYEAAVKNIKVGIDRRIWALKKVNHIRAISVNNVKKLANWWNQKELRKTDKALVTKATEKMKEELGLKAKVEKPVPENVSKEGTANVQDEIKKAASNQVEARVAEPAEETKEDINMQVNNIGKEAENKTEVNHNNIENQGEEKKATTEPEVVTKKVDQEVVENKPEKVTEKSTNSSNTVDDFMNKIEAIMKELPTVVNVMKQEITGKDEKISELEKNSASKDEKISELEKNSATSSELAEQQKKINEIVANVKKTQEELNKRIKEVEEREKRVKNSEAIFKEAMSSVSKYFREGNEARTDEGHTKNLTA